MLFIKWIDAYLFHTLYAGYFSMDFCLCFSTNFKKKSST